MSKDWLALEREASEYFARKLGITPEEFDRRLREARERRGDGCFQLDEIDELLDGDLPEARMKHVDRCERCAAWLKAAITPLASDKERAIVEEAVASAKKGKG